MTNDTNKRSLAPLRGVTLTQQAAVHRSEWRQWQVDEIRIAHILVAVGESDVLRVRDSLQTFCCVIHSGAPTWVGGGGATQTTLTVLEHIGVSKTEREKVAAVVFTTVEAVASASPDRCAALLPECPGW